jgi:glycosyltransferase involved in cell wall biosynthesis
MGVSEAPEHRDAEGAGMEDPRAATAATTPLGGAGVLPPPAASLRAVVVIPARDEEQRIGAALDALGAQVEVAPGAYEVIVVLDACSDGTAAEVEAARARWPELALSTLIGPGRGAGPARAIGMDVACARLEAAGREDGLIASTDADTTAAPDWIARQLDAITAGAEAIGGDIVLDPAEAELLPPGILDRRDADLAERAAHAAARGPAEHAHFAGASLGLTPRAYRLVGGMGELAALEDQELEDRLAGAGVAIHRPRGVGVVTAARIDGRAERGLAVDLELGRWLAERSYDGADFDLERLLAAKTETVAVVLPAREVAATIGSILAAIVPLHDAGLIDELVVVDADSEDGTADIARAAGARVLSENSLAPATGRCRGKGDAMWRAAGAIDADVLVFLDADTADFRPSFVTGMLGPILTDPGVALVKGSFRRPLALDGAVMAGEGGRVTELVARPLLNLHFPRLAGFDQPLAGEIAIRRDLFSRLSVPVGYGVEIAMMIDCLHLAGLDALAQVDLGSRQNRHQSLRALSAMATEVMVAAERRSGGAPRPASPGFRPQAVAGEPPELWRLRCEERPPLADL